jgi:hypothetical protein
MFKVGDRVVLELGGRVRAETEVIVREVRGDRIGVSYGPRADVSWFDLQGNLLRSKDYPKAWRLRFPIEAVAS